MCADVSRRTHDGALTNKLAENRPTGLVKPIRILQCRIGHVPTMHEYAQIQHYFRHRDRRVPYFVLVEKAAAYFAAWIEILVHMTLPRHELANGRFQREAE